MILDLHKKTRNQTNPTIVHFMDTYKNNRIPTSTGDLKHKNTVDFSLQILRRGTLSVLK